jgi:GTP-binding protein
MEGRQPSLIGVSAASEFSSAERESGRLLFAQEWRFATAASSLESLPKPLGIEIAFAGRSNVGKSSLINALVGQHALARTSHTPGRTQELIFFSADPGLTLVDMPGYGYAAAPKDVVKAWTKLIQDYLLGRANLARVYLLIDARHGLKDADTPALDALGKAAVSHQIVLTKADQVKASELAQRIETIEDALKKRPAAFPRGSKQSAARNARRCHAREGEHPVSGCLASEMNTGSSAFADDDSPI